jgi:hypothetical protein
LLHCTKVLFATREEMRRRCLVGWTASLSSLTGPLVDYLACSLCSGVKRAWDEAGFFGL